MKRLIAVAALALGMVIPPPTPSIDLVPQAQAQGLAEVLQGITDPHVVGGASYNKDSKQWAAVLTANIPGIKLGTYPIYLSGVGVALNTIAPGLENAPIAAVSLPFVTIAPWGEAVVVQFGMSTPMGGGLDVGPSYYAGLGVSLSGGPNALRAKRIKRAEAKAKAKKAEAAQYGPVPAS